MGISSIQGIGRRVARSVAIAALVVVGVCGAGAVVVPATAVAGYYDVYMCADGYGAGAFQNGWSSNAGTNLDTAANCSHPAGGSAGQESGKGLQVWSAEAANGAQAGAYWLDAPAGTSIIGIEFAGSFNAYGGWVAHWATSGGGGGDPVSDCGTFQACLDNDPGDTSWPVDDASEIGFGLWCDASTCSKNSSDSMFGPAGSVNIFNATVTIDEPSSPSLRISASPTGWISNKNGPLAGWTVSALAGDPAGVCNLNLSVGSLSTTNDVAPNYGSATSCSADTGSIVLPLDPCASGGLTAATYTPQASAMNPANMWSSASSDQFSVECTGPSVVVTSTENLGAWYPTAQAVDVDASDESGLQGPVTCDVGSSSVTIPTAQLPYVLPVTQNGVNSVSCTAENNVDYSTSANLDGQVKIDSQTPSVAYSGSTPTPAWVSGPLTITVTGKEPTQLSGIASVSCELDGRGWTTTDGSVANVVVSSDGVHTVNCYSVTGAGVKSPTASYTVQIDSPPPAVSFSDGPSQSTWSTTAQSIDVTATKPQGTSGVAQISCTINQQTSVYTNAGATDSQTVKVAVQPPGGDLSCKALDNAGNLSTPVAWNFLIDNTPPTGEFMATDPQRPTLVDVRVADTGSGVSGAQIEIQMGDGWRQLPTTYSAGTGIAGATIPDDGSIADGTYDLQAHVWDLAGNEATITQGSGGTPEAVTLPLRIVTQLVIGQAQASAAGCARICARRSHATATPSLKLRYGQPARVHGLLATIDGTPIPGALIKVSQQSSGWTAQPAGQITTERDGRFTYTLRAGASRAVTFSYAGTGVLRASEASTGVRVTGKAAIDIGSSVVAGRPLQIIGRVYGGYIPGEGVLVQLQYRIEGVPVGWAPFTRAVQTDRRGHWKITFPVALGARGYTYLFRGLVAGQSGWPFLTTITNVIARHVA